MLAQVLIAEADSFVAMWKDLTLPMAATVSCAMAMGRIGQSKPGWGQSRCVAPRCATGATWAPRRKSASARRSLPKWARRTKSLDALLPVLYLRGCRPATSRRRLAPSWEGRAKPIAGGDFAAHRRMADGLRRLAEARPLGAAIRVCVGGRGLPADIEFALACSFVQAILERKVLRNWGRFSL